MSRARLALEPMEDRTVPTVVTIEAVADVVEGSVGLFRLTRSDTSGGDSVSYSTGGTATADDDFILTPKTATFEPGETVTFVEVDTYDDATAEPTETAVLTLDPGAGYTVGTSGTATLNIFDNDAPVVSVAKVADAAEAGSNGTFRFTRIGDLSSSLTANYTVSGTATSGTDFTALSGTVTFAAGASTADVTVAALTDAIYDPDETVSVTVATGTGYTIGGTDTAELSITDDVETVETLIHQETFQLTGTSGPIDVTLTVVYNAPGAAGLYTWSYAVSNPSTNGTAVTSFEVPIDDMDTDVANLMSSIGWTGTVGTDSVTWTAGTGLAPGQSAVFSFTTDPREVGAGTVTATGGGGFLANLPTAPAPRQKLDVTPRAQIDFVNAGTETRQYYTLQIDVTTASGSSYTTSAITFTSATAHDARESLLAELTMGGVLIARPVGSNSLSISGKDAGNGTVDAVKSVKLKITATGIYAPPPEIQSRGGLSVSRELP